MFKVFKDAKRVREMEAKLAEAEAVKAQAENGAYKAAQDVEQARKALSAANTELAQLRAKVREQNEADLLFVSMQITKRLLGGEKKESPQVQMLINQQAALQNAYPYGAYSQGYGLGLGGVLGGIFQ